MRTVSRWILGAALAMTSILALPACGGETDTQSGQSASEALIGDTPTIRAGEGGLIVTVALPKGLVRAAHRGAPLAVYVELSVANDAWQTRVLDPKTDGVLDPKVDGVLDPKGDGVLDPKGDSFVRVDVVVPWDQKDATGALMTGKAVVGYTVGVVHTAGGKIHRIGKASTGFQSLELVSGPVDG